MSVRYQRSPLLIVLVLLAGCPGSQQAPEPEPASAPAAGVSHSQGYYGTLHPFAADAVYFVVTDRFVNGDPGNDQREQGGALNTFDRPIHCPDGVIANSGYLGGDFRGLLDHAAYISEMGFGAVWITPIVDNPNEAFSGGDPITCTSILTDRGKSGYHGYWGSNFYQVDEHLVSKGLGFPELTAGLRGHGLKTVLDIVANHGSPGWSMPTAQKEFGRIHAADGSLLADHQNLPPDQLDPEHEPLHRFFNQRGDLAQLSDLNESNPEVVDYLVDAYLQWIDQGAAAFRVDTVPYLPTTFWDTFTTRIRARHPDFFLFGEAFKFKPEEIALYTWPGNGAMSMLDFPLKAALVDVFQNPGSDYARISEALFLDEGPYQNPYELTTFYDNHDMARMQASDEGFIDAHNWLFTARGIPVIYYGSEIGFMRGRAEHHGNRNYFGVEQIKQASAHPIRQQLARIAKLRASTPALQRGLQLNLEIAGQRAAFLRVLQHEGRNQTALVLLNKGDNSERMQLSGIPTGNWRHAFDGSSLGVSYGEPVVLEVAPHDVSVWLLDSALTDPAVLQQLDRLMARPVHRTSGG